MIGVDHDSRPHAAVVYRRQLLPLSETLIVDLRLSLRRWRPLAICDRLEDRDIDVVQVRLYGEDDR